MGADQSKTATIFPESLTFSEKEEEEVVSKALQKRQNGEELTELEKRLLTINAIKNFVNSYLND